ncbi:MAG: FeoB-associated Cys-rich membrane protein [Clostridia bacterium]|nr:FeoB-associated Cys-rich membrane protein [Clostridia bacterium]
MTDLIIIAVVVVIVGLAGFYVYRAKKSGKKCIGCPEGCSCSSKEGSCSCCHNSEEKK